MRIYCFILFTFLVLSSCASKPEKATFPDQVALPPQRDTEAWARGVWIASTNYESGGRLARLDLNTGKINHEVMRIEADTAILPDGETGLFVLNRSSSDNSITVLQDETGTITAQHDLPEASNPQHALRDPLGQVWVTLQNSDHVQVFQKDLSQLRGTVDLTSLREPNSTDGSSELAQLAMIGNYVVVTAQRLRQNGGVWGLHPTSAYAILNPADLSIRLKAEVAVPNPTSLITDQEQFVLIGSGSSLSATGLDASVGTLRFGPTLTPAQEVETRTLPYRILAASPRRATDVEQNDLAHIAWYPTKNQSCIQLGSKRLVCEGNESNGGYVFNKILRVGSRLFVSYVASGNAALWVLSTDSDEIVKTPMSLRIESLSPGP